MKKHSLKPLALAVGAVLATGGYAAAAQADASPFGLSALSSGYMLAADDTAKPAPEGSCGGHAKDADKKGKEGSCGESKGKEGKCGEGKCGEGKCGEGKGAHTHADGDKIVEGKCGEGKCGEGKCGEGKGAHTHDKGMEGKCGEGKCGENKKS